MKRVDRVSIAMFVALAFGLSWLTVIPIFLNPRHLEWEGARWCLRAMMLGPSAAVLVTRFWLPRNSISTGLRWGAITSTWWIWLVAWLGVPLIVFAAIPLSELFGTLRLDLAGTDAGRLLFEKAPEHVERIVAHPRLFILAIAVAGGAIGAVFNAPLAFAEEWGWRGFLLGNLIPAGFGPAVFGSGLIWGAWHAPIILLGYNYPMHPHMGVLFMILFCLSFGFLTGWMRLASGSLWPSILAHASLNATGGILPLLAPSHALDTSKATVLGWPGWILLIALAAMLAKIFPATQRIREEFGPMENKEPILVILYSLPAPLHLQTWFGYSESSGYFESEGEE